MKLLAPLLSALPLYQAATISFGNTVLDLSEPASEFDLADTDFRGADGGDCAAIGRKQWYLAHKHKMLDFTHARRINVNQGQTIVMEVDEEKDGRWRLGDTQYNKLTINAYSGNVMFSADFHSKMATASAFNYPNNGGWLYVQEINDRNILRFMYGDKWGWKKADGFRPRVGHVITWSRMSHADEGCAGGTGNTFQMVIMNDVKNGQIHKQATRPSRIMMAYPEMNFPAIIAGTRPVVGFVDHDSTTHYIEEMNGFDGDVVDDIANLDDHIFAFEAIDTVVSSFPISGAPIAPQGCNAQQACYCDQINMADNVEFIDPTDGVTVLDMAGANTHFEFKGHCSLDADSMAYGDYAADNRGHFCYIQAKSAEALEASNGMTKVFANSDLIGADPLQRVEVYRFECVQNHNDLGSKPHWSLNYGGKNDWPGYHAKHVRLRRDIKNLRKATRKNRKRNRKMNRTNRISKWQKRQNRKNAAMNRGKGGPQTRSVDNYVVQAGMECQHPADVFTSDYRIPRTPVDGHWDHIDMGFGNGEWKCYDNQDNPSADPTVEYGGWCRIECLSGGGKYPADDASPLRLMCGAWHERYGIYQYGIRNIQQIVKGARQAGFNCP